MKKLYGSFAAKLIAVILLCVMALVFVGSFSAVAAIQSWDGYRGGYRTMEKNYISYVGEKMLSQVGWAYVNGALTKQNLQDSAYTGDGAFQFEILDGKNKVLLSNYEGGETLWTGEREFTSNYSLEMWEDDEAGTEEGSQTVPGPAAPTPTVATVWKLKEYRTQKTYTFYSEEELDQWILENTVTVRGSLSDPLPESLSEARELQRMERLYTWRYDFLWTLGISFLLGVLLFIFLLCAAGHRKGTEEIVPSFVERIPFDLFTLLIGVAIIVCIIPLTGGWDWPEMLIVLIPVILASGLLFLLWCLSFAVRVKTRTLLRSCLIWRLCSGIWRGCSAVFRNLPLLWKWVLGLAALAFVDLIFRMNAVWSERRAGIFWFLFWLLAAAATLYAVLAFRRLRKGAGAIAKGDMAATVEEKYLLGDFKDHARDLNHIRDGLNGAVEQRMKSERFRTELITNVSHDIKTPLTSIVNYVDLLQKEEPQTEKQREYLEVLSRQSGKLKKLIEDLIEASKASTGNLTVDLQPCDLGILLDQTAGEYGEKLEQAGLELVLQKPEKPVTVMADGRHLWRVFDNLLNNIVKYAMPGTRVYLTLREQNDRAEVTFRNISREPLNISAEELTERFVRGDASRHSDGNGLGLAIAMSLMRLQKGDMEIDVDGDLFKATLRFDKV